MLHVKNLIKHFGTQGSGNVIQAVNDVTFSVDQGETFALVGESGSGKTTIGRCLLGLERPTGGGITFLGENIGRSSDIKNNDIIKAKIQLVFQEPSESLNPKMRLHRIVEEPLMNLGLSRLDREKRVKNSFARVKIPEKNLFKYPNELSMGLQQRIGIARAIVSEPKLIILDEPTSALDPTARADIIDLLIEIQKDLGTSYLFISHDLSAVRHISQKIAILYLGKIIEQGYSDRIFSKPKHPYSLGLLSSVLLPSTRLLRPKSLSLAGEIPSPINLPSGCSLESRCPFAQEICAKHPKVEKISDSHFVSCSRHREVAKHYNAMDYFEKFSLEAKRVLLV